MRTYTILTIFITYFTLLELLGDMSWRPWTQSAKRVRYMKGLKRKLPEPLKRWNIVRGDTVELLAGRDKGKQGKIGVVDRKRHRVYVQGLNAHIRHVPAMGSIPAGRILSEAPLHISNVALVDPKDGKPCRINYKYTEDGEKVRVSRRSGMIIPKPPELLERKDWKSRSGYEEGPLDTTADLVTKRTYIPSLTTFEEDIKRAMGIADELPPPESTDSKGSKTTNETEDSSVDKIESSSG